MPTPLIEAPPAVLQLVLEKAVLPHLKKIEKQLKTPLRLAVSQAVAPDRTVQHLVTPRPPKHKDLVTGSARVSFRMNYGGDRFLFRAEVIFPRDLSPETGFSGFSVPGAVTIVGDKYRLDAPSWTVQYNIWEFRGWV